MATINNLPSLNTSTVVNSTSSIFMPVVNASGANPGVTYKLPISTIAALATGATGCMGYTGSTGNRGFQGYTGSQGFGYTGSASAVRGYTGSPGIGGGTTVNLSTVTQSIIPRLTDVFDLGNPNQRWRSVYAAQIYISPTGLLDINTGLPIVVNNATSSTGARGYTGSGSIIPGYTGSQGTPGLGYTGSTGVQGSVGYSGSLGGQGYSGSVGIQGYSGSLGPVGPAGGYTGSRGYTGSSTTGTMGYTGSAGFGYTGSQGLMGYAGSAGTGGGISGVNVWDEDIFVGTFANLNFVGSTVVVSTQSTSSGGYAAITLSATTGTGGIGYTGSAGASGVGYTGSQGLMGYTGSATTGTGGIGYTGSRGYTGSASTGTTGYTGSAGTAGFGYTGSQGLMGYTGSATTGTGGIGYTGSAGASGFGYTGSAGASGFGYTGSTGAAGYTGSLGLTTSTSALLISGLTTLQQTSEVIQALTGATGTVTHDWSQGAIWYHTSVGSSFTVNFTNVSTTNNRSNVSTIIVSQGATPYNILAVQIAGAAQTIKWLGGVAPTATPNKTEFYTFDLLRVGSAWVVTGSLASYG